ncbi:MAG: hypothetical protein JXB50_02320 [Spirochaetes bacterium]|nr:hypothetical protein [Spirochaetota bacterium]
MYIKKFKDLNSSELILYHNMLTNIITQTNFNETFAKLHADNFIEEYTFSINEFDIYYLIENSPDYLKEVLLNINDDQIKKIYVYDYQNTLILFFLKNENELKLYYFTGLDKLPEKESYKIDFTIPLEDKIHLKGFYPSDVTGIWTESYCSEIIFNKSLPKNFNLYIIANAFYNNSKKLTVIQVSNSFQKIMFNNKMTHYKLHFLNPNNDNKITIYIPDPISPDEILLNGDMRMLGLHIQKVIIIPIVK